MNFDWVSFLLGGFISFFVMLLISALTINPREEEDK
jgi:hypothetical protein